MRGAGELNAGPASQACPEPRRGGLRLMIHIDGAARGNPGPAGIGVMLETGDGPLQRGLCRYIGEATNNVAEYEALLLALREARKLQASVVEIRSDSQLLVRQIQGSYRVKNPRLAALHAQARDLISALPSFRIEHVGRELNRQADALANRAIDEALSGVPREGGRS
ncbi:ribonuclease HI family protein [Candidatus Methylomirabilis sp.]|uniref:ribonuclease HI family protein n=1 Tax=Candidatus Methylomirabilis sp. TaxID=2032687 RepID=UPI002A640F78|nr:ribonuclease HI family protein [Candidatus Methylomirabilis sp.]